MVPLPLKGETEFQRVSRLPGWKNWKGGANPAPGKLVDVDFGALNATSSPSETFDGWWAQPGRYRLTDGG